MNRLKQFGKYGLGWTYLLVFRLFETSKIKQADIIFIFPYYHVGGAEQVHLDIVKAVAHKKVTVIFTHLSATDHFLPRFRESATIIELNNIINKKSNRIRQALFNTIARAINRSKSVNHVLGCNTNYFYDVLPLIDSAKKRVDLIHAIAPNDSRVSTIATSAKYIDTRVVINTKAKEDLIDIYENHAINSYSDKISIISNGVDLSTRQEYFREIEYNPLTIGFIGRWSDEKRPWLFLDIAQRVKSTFKNVHFKMAGSGMKGHRTTIEKANVEYIGELSTKKELDDFYKSIAVIIICSSTEGFPMVLMEAMPYGVIPVCTDVGGISEHIIDQENGILINGSSEVELTENLVKNLNNLITNDEKRKDLAKSARRYALDHFDIEKFNQSYRKLFS